MIKWLWEGNHIKDADIPENAVGFIYMIQHIPTGKYYIGKKSLYSIRNLKIGKRELQRIKEERKLEGIRGSLPKKKQVKKESDWRDYMSSNQWIKEQVSEGNELDFKKKILQFCNSTKALTYYELHWQFKYNVLADENSLNDNLLGKFFRKDLES
jgi:hypothetical protein